MNKKKIHALCRTACLVGFVTVAASAASAEGTETRIAAATTNSGFNWLANGNKDGRRKALVRQAARRASFQSTRGGATWICTPAGFGRKSKCHRG